uniref:Uncharacterized protein n=1 Tax=Anguilla anguilla TaxID=7936 RepID=A0A0E9V904_ANGAN
MMQKVRSFSLCLFCLYGLFHFSFSLSLVGTFSIAL